MLDPMRQSKSRLLKTKNREKYAVWIDNDDLDRLREYQKTVGVPVSESVRRAIKAYLEILVKRKRA
jgi:Ribbon-helix-helix domain